MFTALVPVGTGVVEESTAQRTVRDLDHATVALLSNGKPRAVELLTAVGQELRSLYPSLVVAGPYHTDTAMLSSDVQLEEIAALSDAVVIGLGDCGACSACSIQVALDLEDKGVPAVSVCTNPFAVTAREVSSRRGRKDYRFATVQHPLSSLTTDELRQRARDAVPQIIEILTAAQLPKTAGAGRS